MFRRFLGTNALLDRAVCSGNSTSANLPYTGTAMSNGARLGRLLPLDHVNNLTVTPNSTTSCPSWTVTRRTFRRCWPVYLAGAPPQVQWGRSKVIGYGLFTNTTNAARVSKITVTY